MMKTLADVLRNLDNTMGMISRDGLLELLESGERIDMIDLRSEEAWEKSHIKGSKQISMQELPDSFSDILPDKDGTVVCICNGSVQSAMAVVFLRTKGYGTSYNLSGGFSGWVNAELPVEPKG